MRFLILLMLCSAILVGCKSAPERDPAYAAVTAVAMPPKPAGNGAIFQSGYERRWFEDVRARRVGDALTVTLIEETGASISNSSSVSKSNSATLDNPTLLGKVFTDLNASLSTSSSFSGGGDTAQSNQLNGSVTVTVVEILPNGYMRVRGEKRIGTNSGNEYVKLSGMVRPEDIDANNSVPSTKIADATLLYVGDGQIADSNVMGWLSRFFISALMPW